MPYMSGTGDCDFHMELSDACRGTPARSTPGQSIPDSDLDVDSVLEDDGDVPMTPPVAAPASSDAMNGSAAQQFVIGTPQSSDDGESSGHSPPGSPMAQCLSG